MYSWLAGGLFRRLVPLVIRRPGLASILFAEDAEFIFPGSHSWAAHYSNRDDITAWLRRFSATRPNYVVDNVVGSGPPWNLRVAARFRDSIGTDYANKGSTTYRSSGDGSCSTGSTSTRNGSNSGNTPTQNSAQQL